jgi:exodeoxyribonuclease VII small subunit
MTEQKIDFEASMKKLEEIVTKLEKGDTPLESAMRLFEEGTKLAKQLNERLEGNKKKIEKLTKITPGQIETEEING